MNGEYLDRILPAVAADDPVRRLGELFDVHYGRLYRLARRLAPSADDALDLVQETFLKAARSLDSIPESASNEEAWLVRVLINIRRDQWRKRAVRDRYERAEACSIERGVNEESALLAKRAVWQALEVLAPRRRAVIVMYELEGMAIPAIASLLGINAVTVRWHLAKGRRDLLAALNNKPSRR